MAYPDNFLKLSFGGSMYSKTEIWSCSLSIGLPQWTNTFDAAQTQAFVEAARPVIETWFRDIYTGISAQSQLEWIKAAEVGVDGKYVLNASGGYQFYDIYDLPTPVAGGNTQNIAPQLTVAITLNTDVARGLARTGRIYPPTTGSPTSTAMDQNHVQKAETAKTLIDGLNAAAGLHFTYEGDEPRGVIIASNVRTGAFAEVTGVSVGSVIDTQRRRRNQLNETYAAQPVVRAGV